MSEQVPPTEENGEDQRPAGPRIYVASLSDYNAGVLHGVWLDCNDSVEALRSGIDQMLADSPATKRWGEMAEEWAIHDYEGFGRHIQLNEYESLERVSRLARGIAEHGDAFAAWWSIEEPDDEDWGEIEVQFQDRYLGEYESLEKYGEQVLEDMGCDLDEIQGIPEGLRPYLTIDVAAWARDMEVGGDITTMERGRGVYVFCNA